MKIPVLIELFHQIKQGKLKLDDRLPIKNEFHSIVDGSLYTLSAADDSEAELYKGEGQTRTLRELSNLMIIVSSNFATNLLVEKARRGEYSRYCPRSGSRRNESAARSGGRQSL
jgi:beta-lactamase class A